MNPFANLLHQYFSDPKSLEIGFSILVFVISFLESFAIVGAVMPGTILLFGAAGLAIKNDLIGLFVIMACTGSFLADVISFYLGTKGNVYISHHMRKYQAIHEKVHTFFTKYGAFAIIIGKIVGTLRPFTPFIAGTSGMKSKKFIIYSIVAAPLWAGTYLLITYNFGKYIHRISKVWVFVGIAIFFMLLAYWIIQRDERPSSSPDLPQLKKHEK